MRKQNSVRLSLFLLSMSDNIALASSDIVRLRLTVIFYSPIKLATLTSERANTTRRKPNITAYTMQLYAISLAAGE